MNASLYSCLILLFLSCFQKDLNIVVENKAAPKILTIYPTKDSLPENLLRFYVQFSKPMKAVNNLESIKLLNEHGAEIKGAIFNNVYELWDSEQKLLTLILDPARVKAGLVANETLGRALEPGKQFQLIIEKAEDIYGRVLNKPFVKNIYVLKEDIKSPNIKNWKIIPPKADSKFPLSIQFPQTLDRLSLSHRIRLVTSDNKNLEGNIKIGNQEKEWMFYPKEKWQKGIYTLQVNSRLEDPSGNNLNGLFDHTVGSLLHKQEGMIQERRIDIQR